MGTLQGADCGYHAGHLGINSFWRWFDSSALRCAMTPRIMMVAEAIRSACAQGEGLLGEIRHFHSSGQEKHGRTEVRRKTVP